MRPKVHAERRRQVLAALRHEDLTAIQLVSRTRLPRYAVQQVLAALIEDRAARRFTRFHGRLAYTWVYTRRPR